MNEGKNDNNNFQKINKDKMIKIRNEFQKIFNDMDFKNIFPNLSFFKIQEEPSDVTGLSFKFYESEFSTFEDDVEDFDINEKNLPEYDMEIETLLDILELNEFTDDQQQRIRKLLLCNQAKVLSQSYFSIYNAKIEEIEDKARKIDVEGYSYDSWEECCMYFYVDNERFEIFVGGDTILHLESNEELDLE